MSDVALVEAAVLKLPRHLYAYARRWIAQYGASLSFDAREQQEALDALLVLLPGIPPQMVGLGSTFEEDLKKRNMAKVHGFLLTLGWQKSDPVMYGDFE